MPDLQKMSRLLYCHNWDRVENWAAAVHQLADLTDNDIIQLPALGDGASAAAPPRFRWPAGLDGLFRLFKATSTPRTP